MPSEDALCPSQPSSVLISKPSFAQLEPNIKEKKGERGGEGSLHKLLARLYFIDHALLDRALYDEAVDSDRACLAHAVYAVCIV